MSIKSAERSQFRDELRDSRRRTLALLFNGHGLLKYGQAPPRFAKHIWSVALRSKQATFPQKSSRRHASAQRFGNGIAYSGEGADRAQSRSLFGLRDVGVAQVQRGCLEIARFGGSWYCGACWSGVAPFPALPAVRRKFLRPYRVARGGRIR